MKEKTDVEKTLLSPEFSNRFVYALIITACATLLVVFGSRIVWGDIYLNNYLAKPEAIAHRISVEYAIDEFQGIQISDFSTRSRLYMLSAIVLNFVLAPLGFLLCWKNIVAHTSSKQEGESKSEHHWLRTLTLIVSGILLAHVLIINVVAAVVGSAFFRTMQRDNAADGNRSLVVYELIDVGFKASQYYFLPLELGGGGLSFRSHHETAKEPWVSLSELDVPEATSAGSYTIKKVENDTIMLLRGVGKFRLSDGTYPEYEIRMTPSSSARALTKIN